MSDIQARQFGRYELLERLGAGGMAEVHRARYTAAPGITKPVVIKRVLRQYAQEPAFVEMFLNEARISVGLSHGNIVQVFDFGQVDGEYFLAMELVDGQPLSAMLKRAKAEGLPWLAAPLAVGIVIDMCRGLHYAHTRMGEDGEPLGLVHRDISPDNVLVSYEGEVKLTDFGIAKARLAGRAETDAGVVKGKYLYFSPEQAKGEPLDARSDVYAVGVVLYQLLCGRRPVEGGELEVMTGIVEGRLTPAQKLNPAIDARLWEILRQALATSKEARYPTAEALQVALSEWLGARAPFFPAHTRKHLLGWLFREQLAAQRRAPLLPPEFSRIVERWRAEVAPPPDTLPWEVAAIALAATAPEAAVTVTPWPARASPVAQRQDMAPMVPSPPRRRVAPERLLRPMALGFLALGALTLLLGWGILKARAVAPLPMSPLPEPDAGDTLLVPPGGVAGPMSAVLREQRHSFNPVGAGDWIQLNPDDAYSIWTEGEYQSALPPDLATRLKDDAPMSGCLLLFAEGEGLSLEQRLWMVSEQSRPLTGASRLKAFTLRFPDWPFRDEGQVGLMLQSKAILDSYRLVAIDLKDSSIEVRPPGFFTFKGLNPGARYFLELRPWKGQVPGPVAMLISSRRDILFQGPNGVSRERMQVLNPGRYTVSGAQELRLTLPRVTDDVDTAVEVLVTEEGR